MALTSVQATIHFAGSRMEKEKKPKVGTSLVVQWLRNHLSMQGTRVQALVQEDPTCHRATKAMRHNY